MTILVAAVLLAACLVRVAKHARWRRWLLALPIANFAVRFGPPEMVALVVLGLLMVTYLGTGSPVNPLAIF